MYEPPPQVTRQRVPKDGFGPRGVPECYYTSRVLNSTSRYVKFVKKLRAKEEDERIGVEYKFKELKDKQTCDFFIRSDRRSLINNVARRVDLCMASYEQDLQRKRQRLVDMFTEEEERNIRKFVEQAQQGAELIWQEKVNRLQYLLEKRKKEHEEKYKDTPLSKCVHVLPCIYKLRAKEAQEIQLYQIKEKQAKKMAEKEFDKMWHKVTMSESEALAARLEQDEIEHYRRQMECKQYNDYQLEQKKIQREKEKEMLKQEAIRFKAMWDEDNRKEEEAVRERAEKRMAMTRERELIVKDRQETCAKQKIEAEFIDHAWDMLVSQDMADEKAKQELRKRKEMDLDICNKKMIELKQELAKLDTAGDEDIKKEAKRLQDLVDKKRCDYLTWSQKTNEDVRKAMVDQIKEREEAKEVLKKKLAEQDEYQRQLFAQLEQLVAHKNLTDAQARKDHQRNLLQQIEYNKLLKERARQEELDQIKKCQIATEEYQQEISRMLCRPFFSDDVHPFMKQMAKGMQMKDKCPCSKSDYCK